MSTESVCACVLGCGEQEGMQGVRQFPEGKSEAMAQRQGV